eukprot:767893-Heterocapsa_arctica.AAC.1
MDKQSPSFRRWQEATRKAATDMELRVQGEALAAIMQSKFQDAMDAAIMPTPWFQQDQPAPPPAAKADAGADAKRSCGSRRLRHLAMPVTQ